jgi:glutamyl-tRNA synthetase
LHLQDIIRGDVKFETSWMIKCCLKATECQRIIANIVDDHLMETSMLFVVNGCLPCPYTFYCTEPLAGMRLNLHLPLILKPVGNGKLSKRDGDKWDFYFHWSGKEEGISSGYRKRILPKPL